MLLILLHTAVGAPSPSYVNASPLIGDLWPALNATGAADAVFWTEDELYVWFNEAAVRLAGCSNVFVERDTSITAAIGTPTYDLPVAHMKTIQADLNGTVLRARTVKELEALDAGWPATEGTPKAFALDNEGMLKITLYPVPDAGADGKVVGLIMRETPATVSAAAGFLTAPAILEDYFAFSILAEARAIETRAPMLEISQWLKGITGMYEQTIQSYLGGA